MFRFNSHLPYWRAENNEDLTSAIKALSHYMDVVNPQYFKSDDLETKNIHNPTAQQYSVLRAYLSQWATYDGWRVTKENQEALTNLHTLALHINDLQTAIEWIKTANSIGIDPF